MAVFEIKASRRPSLLREHSVVKSHTRVGSSVCIFQSACRALIMRSGQDREYCVEDTLFSAANAWWALPPSSLCHLVREGNAIETVKNTRSQHETPDADDLVGCSRQEAVRAPLLPHFDVSGGGLSLSLRRPVTSSKPRVFCLLSLVPQPCPPCHASVPFASAVPVTWVCSLPVRRGPRATTDPTMPSTPCKPAPIDGLVPLSLGAVSAAHPSSPPGLARIGNQGRLSTEPPTLTFAAAAAAAIAPRATVLPLASFLDHSAETRPRS